jgi:hypothetical protein
MSNKDMVVRLRDWKMAADGTGFGSLLGIFDEAADQIKRLRAERDEARRSCCEYAAIVDGADTADGMESGRFYEIAMKYMKDRGWDCFKEDGRCSHG